MKKILITGETGFIGSHLVELLKQDYEIVGLSRNKRKNSNFSHISGDICKITHRKIPKDIDGIIHLAALTDVSFCQSNPVNCYDVNVRGTQNMLEIARNLSIKFFHISSQHVYGNPKSLPIKESHPINPSSIYSTSKSVAELISLSYMDSYKLDVTILRLFSVYGPKSPNHLVTNRLISQLVEENEFRLGNLSPKRDFIYIDDVINAISLILKKSKNSEIYNIGSGKSYSILEICNFLQKIGNKKMPIHSIKSLSRKSDVPNIVADNSKLKKLGWKNKTSIIDGLWSTYDWHLNKSKKP